MGQTKQLLEWEEGKTILQEVLENLLHSQLDEVILVLGHEADRILDQVDTRRVKVVINKNYREGMITSIQQGLTALNEKVEAFFIVLADQPGVDPKIFETARSSAWWVGAERRLLCLPWARNSPPA